MNDRIKLRLLGKAALLVILSFCVWAFSGAVPKTQDKQPVAIIAVQLPQREGVVPVELRCALGLLSAPGVLESFRCVFKNNTNKAVSAANVIYSVVFEQAGKESETSYASSVDTKFHPDFANMSKPINPGDESGNLGPPGPVSVEGSVIKSIRISIDYIEFSDGSTMGVDSQGSRIIKSMRQGAEKYKDWFRTRYNQNQKSLTPTAALLYEQSLPIEVKFLNADEEQGARTYRNLLRKEFENKGDAEVEKHLKPVTH